MKRIVFGSVIIALAAALLVPGIAVAQDKYPSKPINVIVPFSAGGSTDLPARAIEKVWPKYSSQPLVLINKPGGGGAVGTEFVVRSKPDGYTLYFGFGSGHDTVMPHLQKLPYDTYLESILATSSTCSAYLLTKLAPLLPGEAWKGTEPGGGARS